MPDPSRTTANRNLFALVGHEWGESIKAGQPEMWSRLQPFILSHAEDARKQADALRNRRYSGRETLDAELTNNMIGDAFADPEFWKTLATQDKGLFERILEAIRQWFASLSEKAANSEWGTQEFTNRLREMHEGLAEFVRESAASEDQTTAAEGIAAATMRLDSSNEIVSNEVLDELDSRLFKDSPGDSRGGARDAAQSAQAFLRGSDGASGSPESGKAKILEWAKKNGRLISKLPWKLDGPKDKGQGEHHVFYDKQSSRWVKITKGSGSAFGRTLDLRGKKWSIGRAAAIEYLERIRVSNALFGDDTIVHGVFADKHGNVNIVTSQSDKEGKSVSAADIEEAMKSEGFHSLRNSSYYRIRDNMLILDLHEDNAVHHDGKMRVFDAIALHPSESQRNRLITEGAIKEEWITNDAGNINAATMRGEVTPADEAKALELAATPNEELSKAEQALLERVANKQIEDVRKRLEGTPGWMKGPKGQPTKLTERQWLQVRTPLFKRWFGDWEAAGHREFLEGPAVASFELGAIRDEGQGAMQAAAAWARENLPSQINRADMGDIITNEKTVLRSLGHRFGDVKLSAVTALQPVIEQGRVIWQSKDKDGKPIQHVVLAAPVSVGGKSYQMAVRLKQDMNGTRFHVHELFLSEKVKELASFQSGPLDSFETLANTTGRKLYGSLLRRIFSVNPDSVSKVVDENGEPMVVYHGSGESFNRFDLSQARQQSDIPAFFFTTQQEEAKDGYGENVTEAFLNIRNMVEKPESHMEGRRVREQLEREGYDGTIIEDEYSTEYAAFDPNQIKSATGNSGVFTASENINAATMRESALDVELRKRMRNPEQRVKILERAREKLLSITRANRDVIEGIATRDVSVPSDAALDQLEQERAATIADVDLEEKEAIRKSGEDITERFAHRIEGAKTEGTRRALEREAKARATERRRGIEQQFAERRKAVEADFRNRKRQVKTEAARAEAEGANQKDRETSEARLIHSLEELNALLSVFPPEIRGKVGGFVTLAKSSMTEKALTDFFVKRIDMVDRELERMLKREYDAKLKRIFKRSRPVKGKPGEKPKGKAGADIHALFDVLQDAVNMSAEEVEAHLVGIDSRIASIPERVFAGKITEEQGAEEEAHALMESALVGLVGNWRNADADRRATAIQELSSVWEKGYREFQEQKIADKEHRKGVRAALREDTGMAGTREERKARAAKDNGFKKGWEKVILNLLNFEQVSKWVFGENSEWGQRIADMERKASNQNEDAVQEKMDAMEKFFTDLAGGSRLAGERLQWGMSQDSMNVDGNPFSEMEAITALMMWRQEDGRRHMIGRLDEVGKASSRIMNGILYGNILQLILLYPRGRNR